MRNTILLMLTFIVFSTVASSQNLKVIYRCSRSISFADQLESDKKRNPHAANFIDQMHKYAEQVDAYAIDFKLEQAGQVSNFEMIPDGNDGISTWNYETGSFSYSLVTKDDQCYKNLAASNLVLTRSRNKIEYCVKDHLFDFCWNIQTDSKKIIGYTAYKAIGTYQGREITAWFTPDIPISNGPLEYGGLPGLILELEIWDNPSVFKAIELEISKDNTPDITPAYCRAPKQYTINEMWIENDRIKNRNRKMAKSKK